MRLVFKGLLGMLSSSLTSILSYLCSCIGFWPLSVQKPMTILPDFPYNTKILDKIRQSYFPEYNIYGLAEQSMYVVSFRLII